MALKSVTSFQTLLYFRNMAQCIIPTLLKLRCYESILGFYGLILPLNTVRLVSGLLKCEFNRTPLLINLVLAAIERV